MFKGYGVLVSIRTILDLNAKTAAAVSILSPALVWLGRIGLGVGVTGFIA